MEKNIQHLTSNRLEPEELVDKVVILYHANCLDGMVAAMVTKRYLETFYAYGNLLDPITVRPVRYGDLDVLQELPIDSVVYMVDLSFPVKQLTAYYNGVNRPKMVRIIDHHATFINDVKNMGEDDKKAMELSDVLYLLAHDNAESGASLALHYFSKILGWKMDFTQDELKLIETARRFDLWEHEGNTKDDASYLAAYMSLTMESEKTTLATDYNYRSRALGVPLKVALAAGKSYQEQLDAEAKAKMLDNGMVFIIDGDNALMALVVACDARHNPSIIDMTKGQYDFYMFYHPRKAVGYKYSLRAGRNRDLDLSQWAKVMSDDNEGGGHKEAAGFVSGAGPLSTIGRAVTVTQVIKPWEREDPTPR